MTAAEARTLFRELTGEFDTSIVPDATIDYYMQLGLEGLNRRTGYRVTEGTISLVAGTQEYTLPTDYARLVWVYHTGPELKRSSVREWQTKGVDWRLGEAGFPREYALLGPKILLWPTPSTAAVDAAATVTLRYVGSPGAFSASVFDGLGEQSHRPVVMLAVAYWRAAHPDSDMAAGAGKAFLDFFDAESAGIAAEYQARGLER